MCYPSVTVDPSLIRPRMEMENRTRRFFGAETCIIILAAFQIVSYSCLAFLFFIGLGTIAAVPQSDVEPVLEKIHAFKFYESHAYAILMFLLSFMVIFYFVGAMMGVVLLRGVTQRNVKYLNAWTYYAIASVSISFCEALLGKPRGPDTKALLQLIVTCSFYGLCDFLVRGLILEIRASRVKDSKTVIPIDQKV